MKTSRMRGFKLLAVIVALFVDGISYGGDGGCVHCGCASPSRKICRLICEEKKITVVCWGCESEDFCVPGPSKRICKHKELVCEDCDPEPKVKTGPKKFAWGDWLPGCASIFTKHKIMKKPITKTVPSYKWVVEHVCAECERKCVSVTPASGISIPPAPVTKRAQIP